MVCEDGEELDMDTGDGNEVDGAQSGDGGRAQSREYDNARRQRTFSELSGDMNVRTVREEGSGGGGGRGRRRGRWDGSNSTFFRGRAGGRGGIRGGIRQTNNRFPGRNGHRRGGTDRGSGSELPPRSINAFQIAQSIGVQQNSNEI